MYKVLSKCPVCNQNLKVIRLKCARCSTTIENEFSLSKFDYLTSQQLYFIETFVKCRGSIKDVEKELGISYPTVRAKLDEVILALGYDVIKEAQNKKEKSDILEALEQPSQEIITVKDYDNKMLRVNIESHEGDEVKLKLPVKVIKTIIKATGKLPMMSTNVDGVNMDELIDIISSSLDSSVMGEILNINSADGDIVKILVE